jgi:signal transduction histidine kinase
MNDFVIIVGLSLATCFAIGLVGAGLLHLVRGRSLRYQLMIIALLPVLAVAGTVVLNVRFMFLSAHDSTVVLVALGIAVVVALVGAWWVMRRVTHGSAVLGVGLRQLVADSGRPEQPGVTAQPPGSSLPLELSDVLHDLEDTRRKLTEARAREHAAEDARRELVAFMSHDLRTPLAGLRALAEGLEDGVVTDLPRSMAHMRATVGRMSHLVDDLFELSRVQGSAEPKATTLVSVKELITDVASETSASATARLVELRTEVPSRDRLSVLGSADDLARALTNLVVNAIRHTRPGETVRLTAERADDGHIQVAVIDGCGGIPDSHLQRVFQAGWRGTPSRGGDEGGSGLGLAIARGVVESHAGSIAVSNVAGGCRFEFDLPVPRTGLNSS